MASLFEEAERELAEQRKTAPTAGSLFDQAQREIEPRVPIAGTPEEVGAFVDQREVEGSAGSFRDALTEGASVDANATARYLAGKMFPGVPEKEAVRNFRVKEGRLQVRTPGGYQNIAAPGFNLKNAARELPRALPEVAGAAGAVLSAPLAATGPGLLGAAGITAGAAGAGEFGRQALGDFLTGDQPYRYSPAQAGYEAVAAGLVPEIPGAAAVAARGIPINREAAAAAAAPQALGREERAARYGVQLTPAEASGSASLAQQQKVLTKSGGSSDIMRRFYETRDQTVQNVMEELTDSVFLKGRSPLEALGQAREAAQGLAAEVIQERRAKATELYGKAADQAQQQRLTFDPSGALQELGRVIMQGENTPLAAKLRPFYDSFYRQGPDGGRVLKRDLGQLDVVLKSIQDELDNKPSSTLGKTAKKTLVQAKEKLEGELETFAPYKRARDTFSEDSRVVDDVIGLPLNAITKLEDPELQKAALMVLNPQTQNTRTVKLTFDALRAREPEAATGILGAYIRQNIDTALTETERGVVPNPAGKMRKALYGGNRKRSIMEAAMSPEEFRAFDDYMGVLQDVASVELSGSDTAFNLEAQNRLRAEGGLASRGLRNSLRLARPDIVGVVGDALKGRADDAVYRRIAETITRPGARDKLKQLRQIGPRDARIRAQAGFLAGSLGVTGLEELAGGEPGPAGISYGEGR